jgi:hypothetical protein
MNNKLSFGLSNPTNNVFLIKATHLLFTSFTPIKLVGCDQLAGQDQSGWPKLGVADQNIKRTLVYFVIKNYMLILNMIYSNFLKLLINISIVAGFLCSCYVLRLPFVLKFLDLSFRFSSERKYKNLLQRSIYKAIQ